MTAVGRPLYPPSTAVPPTPPEPFASVIVPTYNRGDVLADTVDYLLANTYAAFEVIVVDQTRAHAPALEARLAAFEADPRFRRLRLPIANLPLARNAGRRAARGEVIVYCDDDVSLGPGFVAAHARRYADATVGAVAGRFSEPGGRYYGPDLPERPRPGIIHPDASPETHFDQEGSEWDVAWGQGCNMSFRRSALEAVGGFDERFTKFVRYEEVDTFVRVRAAGWRAVFASDATLVHLVEPSGGSREEAREVARLMSTYRNKTLFYLNNPADLSGLRVARTILYNAYSYGRIVGHPTMVLRALASMASGAVAYTFGAPDALSRKLAAQDPVEELPAARPRAEAPRAPAAESAPAR